MVRRLAIIVGGVSLLLAVLLLWLFLRRETPPADNLLAFTLVDEASVSAIYVYNPVDGSVGALGLGNDPIWSPQGTYLATFSRSLVAGQEYYKFSDFTIWDVDTNTSHSWNYGMGVSISWSPNETYLVLTGYIRTTMSESNSWINIFSGDGAHQLPSPTDVVTRIPGGYTGVIPLRWTDDHQLHVYLDGLSRNYSYLFDPATGEQHPVTDEPLPDLYAWGQTTWGQAMNVVSPDGRYRASVPDNSDIMSAWVNLTPILLIEDITTCVTYKVPLPPNTVDVQHMAWRPARSS